MNELDIEKALNFDENEFLKDVFRQVKLESMKTIAKEKKELMKKPKLVDLFLEVTSRCNARCEHCGSSCGDFMPKDEITKEELEKALLDIHNAYGGKNVYLFVTGGEPLVRKDLFDIMKYARSLGYNWGMTTNGMLINDKIIEKMKETEIRTISISLDGLKETHEKFRKVPGSFDIIIDNLKKLQKLDCLVELQVTTVANKKNLHELESVYNLLLDIGIKNWRLATVDPIGRAKANDEILLDKDGYNYVFNFIKEKRQEGKIKLEYGCSHYLGVDNEMELRDYYFNCGTGIHIGSILSNGDIFACPNIERRKELIQGNIRKDNFVDVWENKYELFRKKRANTNAKCKRCKSYKYCHGDSFHTWNFDDNKPNICMKEIFGKDFYV